VHEFAPAAVLALGLVLPGTGSAAAIAGTGDARVLAGELTRVDLTRRGLSVKLDGREGRELDADTAPDTRVLSHGRTLRLEDLRPGDRVVVVLAPGGPKRVAAVVKVVGRPTAVASPSPTSPPSTAPAPPAPSGSPG
jgi:hypothetical protein